HVGPLGFHPGGRVLAVGQFRDCGGCPAGRRGTAVEMPTDRGGGAHVVISQPEECRLAVVRVIGFRERAGVLSDQVVHAIAPAGGFGDQVMIEELVKTAAGGRGGGGRQVGG